MSYQYKFQDDDQTKIKGSVKYVLKEQPLFSEDVLSLDIGWFANFGFMWRGRDFAFSPGLRSGFFGTVVEYGAERKISRHSILGATVSVGVPQGVSLKIK